MQYHLIFVCKYRKKLLVGNIADDMKQICFEISQKYDFEINGGMMIDKSGEIDDSTVFKMLGGAFTNSFDENERRDSLQLRKAKIVELMKDDDNRIRVRVLGLNSNAEDKDNLPCFFPFFQGTYTPGDEGDVIWVVCTRDCQQGYYLGQMPIFTSNKSYISKTAYGYKQIKKFLQQRKACPKDFSYKNIVIDKCTMSKEGGIVEGYNRKTGDWFLINSTGSIITVQQGRVYIRVGSPANPISSGPTGFSSIEMMTDQVEVKTPNFIVNADKVVLGHHGLNLAGMVTDSPCVGMNNVPVMKVDNISV